MHDEILSESQKALLPLIGRFSSVFGLVGGTAIALHLGHRRSIDFDLFTPKDFDGSKLKAVIREKNKIQETLVENPNQLTLLVDGVNMTFYKYPFPIVFSEKFNGLIRLPDLLTLAAMKAFALGQRAKWKDYVDLSFIFEKFSLKDVATKASELFGSEFNGKLLREQLSYFKDIDYSEKIDYLEGFEKNDKEITEFLSEVSLEKP
ncbi:nucleotidyl transferase AbiEii/AbiGii toxin family protein [Candidatus Woesebacteria bacterium]|nr:nucleotidyl transferase AbiEii/AbiGii toxin family protein [Candidatus Woesebacteria bacterium]